MNHSQDQNNKKKKKENIENNLNSLDITKININSTDFKWQQFKNKSKYNQNKFQNTNKNKNVNKDMDKSSDHILNTTNSKNNLNKSYLSSDVSFLDESPKKMKVGLQDSNLETLSIITEYKNSILESKADKEVLSTKEACKRIFENNDTISSLNKSSLFKEDILSPNTDSESAYIDELSFLEGKRVGKYRLTKSLGSGSSCRVKLGINLDTGEKVAIKIVKRDEETKMKEDRIYREVLISSLLCHPHIVRLKNFYFNESFFFLIFEYVNGVQLLDLVLQEGALKEKNARRFFRQILSAISYIHENCIAHRDLKIENILIDEYDNVKILDFGLSNFFDTRRYLNTFCGSLYFAAPELLLGKEYVGPEIDIWSLGVILYVLLNGKVPFDDKNIHVLHNKIKEGKFTLRCGLSADSRDLLTNMIMVDNNLRYDLTKIMESKWINKGYKTKIDNFMNPRNDLTCLDEKLLFILSTITKDQFPGIISEVKRFHEACKNKNITSKEFWLKKPTIALYYLMLENFETFGKLDLNHTNIIGEEINMDKSENMHHFVNFLYTKERENIFSKYFLGSVFVKSNTSINHMNLRNEFDTHTNLERTTNQLETPKIKKSFIKGIFTGLLMKNINCKNKLRTLVQTCLINNKILYEIMDKHYVCSIGHGLDYCSFKISLYRNVIFGGLYLSMRRIIGCRKRYAQMFAIFKEMAKKGQV